MEVATSFLRSLIAKQVDDKGLVVWYDPEQAYGVAAAELSLPNTTVVQYDGSFLKHRKELDHLLNDSQPPRLVVYVPMQRTETDSALIEPQVGMDNVARKALIPLENKRDFLEVSGDIVERVDPVFFSDPMTAAMKALGLT